MKKLLIIVAVLIVLVIGGAAAFIATFDANRYKPAAIQKIEELTGAKAAIGNISLGWQGGLSLRAAGVSLTDASSGETTLSVDSVSAGVRLMPLLSKKIEVTRVDVVRPNVKLVKTADGRVTVQGVVLGAGGETASAPPSKAPAPPAAYTSAPDFSVGLLKIEDGEVSFTDRSKSPATVLTVKRLNATVKNVSLRAPMSFDVQAALFGEEQNLASSGSFLLPQAGKGVIIDGFELEADLTKMDRAEILKLAPSLDAVKLEGAGGKFKISVDHLDTQDLPALTAKTALNGGWAETGWVKEPIQNLTFDAVAAKSGVTLNTLSGRIGKGRLNASARVTGLDAQPQSTFKIDGQELPVEAFMKTPEGAPFLKGALTFGFEGNTQALTQPAVLDTLSGQGKVVLKDATLVNVNILRMVFDKLSMIPTLTERLQNRLPESYGARLAQRDTPLGPVELPVVIQNGNVAFDNLQISTPDVALYLRGQTNLHGVISAVAMLQISAEVSDALARSVEELRSLMNPQGQIEIPLTIEGKLPRPDIKPDYEYITQRVVMSKGSELLSGLLQKGQKQEGEAGAEGTSSGSSVENLLKYF